MEMLFKKRKLKEMKTLLNNNSCKKDISNSKSRKKVKRENE